MDSNGMTVCDGPGVIGLERTRFFPRQLIGPDDLTQDQRYVAEKLRRHNRLLHGWGVVCGARVRAGEGCSVIVEPGVLLAPQGHEIVIPQETGVDLCREDVDGNAVGPCAPPDPWCADVRAERDPGRPLYLAIRHAECRTRPVRVVTGCGCGDGDCEYSRTRDSFALKALPALPESHRGRPATSLQDAAVCRPGPPACPPCPDDPWVLLATITLSGGAVKEIDCDTHRRHVVSLAPVFFTCGARNVRIAPVPSGPRFTAVGLVDASAPPASKVAVRLPDGAWAELEARVSVQPGDTFASLIAREGGQELEDAATGDRVTLAEVYALAAVDPLAPVASAAQALVPLEGVQLRAGDLRLVRRRLSELVDQAGLKGLDAAAAGAPEAAADLAATTLRGIGPGSTIGARLGGTSIAEVSAKGRDAFVAEMVAGLPPGRRATAERKAEEVWMRAETVSRLAHAWARGS